MHNRIMLIGVFNAGKRAIAIEWGFSGGLGSSAITESRRHREHTCRPRACVRSVRRSGWCRPIYPNTVKSYIRTIYRKIEVGSRTQALLWGSSTALLQTKTASNTGAAAPELRHFDSRHSKGPTIRTAARPRWPAAAHIRRARTTCRGRSLSR
jgi:hypothetical protein